LSLKYECQLTVFAQFSVWEAKFPRSLVHISATVIREQFINSCGLRRLSPVISESRTAKESHHRLEQVLERSEQVETSKLSVDILCAETEDEDECHWQTVQMLHDVKALRL